VAAVVSRRPSDLTESTSEMLDDRDVERLLPRRIASGTIGADLAGAKLRPLRYSGHSTSTPQRCQLDGRNGHTVPSEETFPRGRRTL